MYLKTLSDDSLLIRANSQAFEIKTTYTIDLDADTPEEKATDKEEYIDYLFNLMLTAYIIGYQTIIIKKENKIPIKIKNRIHRMTRKLYGMVVISESQTQIVLWGEGNTSVFGGLLGAQARAWAPECSNSYQ